MGGASEVKWCIVWNMKSEEYELWNNKGKDWREFVISPEQFENNLKNNLKEK